MEFGVNSEIGKLRRVLMHRPGEEIIKVTKESLDLYRFRKVPNLSKMQEEFDDFTSILKENKVEVILLEDLTDELTSPNFLFTRDIIGVSPKGLLVMNMAVEGRKDEPKIIKKALKEHIPVHVEIKKPGLLEGGDLVFVDKNVLAIGYGPRSNLAGVKKLVKKIKRTSIKEIILVPLPPYRVHLDGAFMVIDHTLAVVHESSLRYKKAQIIKGNSTKEEFFLDYLRLRGFRTIASSDDETKNFGPNILSIEAAKVISYAWNERIIRGMEKRGVEVILLEGKELVKGGGGPHCMTSPILRD